MIGRLMGQWLLYHPGFIKMNSSAEEELASFLPLHSPALTHCHEDMRFLALFCLFFLICSWCRDYSLYSVCASEPGRLAAACTGSWCPELIGSIHSLLPPTSTPVLVFLPHIPWSFSWLEILSQLSQLNKGCARNRLLVKLYFIGDVSGLGLV